MFELSIIIIFIYLFSYLSLLVHFLAYFPQTRVDLLFDIHASPRHSISRVILFTFCVYL
jgi:hypothetical protein